MDKVKAENREISIADYEPHPRNYNRHPAQQVERIAKSLQKFGQVRSVVVWREYVLAGHGVSEAALSLGYETLRADILPDDYPEHLALAYVAADNELGRMADPDPEQLLAILEQIAQVDDELVEAVGYDDVDLATLVSQIVDPSEFEPVDESEQPRLDQRSPITCPHCGMEFVPA